MKLGTKAYPSWNLKPCIKTRVRYIVGERFSPEFANLTEVLTFCADMEPSAFTGTTRSLPKLRNDANRV